jgi:hypothetical protein
MIIIIVLPLFQVESACFYPFMQDEEKTLYTEEHPPPFFRGLFAGCLVNLSLAVGLDKVFGGGKLALLKKML